jgi:hypothetical protein
VVVREEAATTLDAERRQDDRGETVTAIDVINPSSLDYKLF